MEKHINAPFDKEQVKDLKAGDYVYISGTIYSARDAAHKRMYDAILASEYSDADGKTLYEKGVIPFDLTNNVIYYLGPTPAKEGQVIGSAGPTTSYRMDAYAPRLLDLGQLAMIGKGQRSDEVMDAVVRNGAVYFAAIGGAAALMAGCVKSAEVIAFDDLGAEAVRKLYVEDLPVTVVLDSAGGNLYKEGQQAYLESAAK